jgi:hypothetical protein
LSRTRAMALRTSPYALNLVSFPSLEAPSIASVEVLLTAVPQPSGVLKPYRNYHSGTSAPSSYQVLRLSHQSSWGSSAEHLTFDRDLSSYSTRE